MRKMQEKKEKQETRKTWHFLEPYPLLRTKQYEALLRRDSVLNRGSGTGLFSYSVPLQTLHSKRWTFQACFYPFDNFLISLKGKNKSQSRTSKKYHFPQVEPSCGFQFNYPRKPGLTTALRIRIQKADLDLKQRTGRGGRAASSLIYFNATRGHDAFSV